MIQMGTILDVADNSGAKKIACINLLGGSKGKYGNDRRHHHRVGQGGAAGRQRSRRGRSSRRSIVRTRKAHRRKDGSLHPLRHELGGLDRRQREPIGTRVFGPVARELRDKRFMKIVSLAPEVLCDSCLRPFCRT